MLQVLFCTISKPPKEKISNPSQTIPSVQKKIITPLWGPMYVMPLAVVFGG